MWVSQDKLSFGNGIIVKTLQISPATNFVAKQATGKFVTISIKIQNIIHKLILAIIAEVHEFSN